MIRVAILGATGSIGTSALSVVDAHADRVRVVGLAAATSAEQLAPAVARYAPTAVSMATGEALTRLGALADLPAARGVGDAGLVMVATRPDVDVVLCASSGTAALEAVLAAIDAGKTIALANKEVLVMAGGLVMDRARARGVAILPVDSEHNAIHQCLHGHGPGHVKRLILTASGGPFRGRTRASLAAVTPAEALRHPTWQMGPKITIDSATLMNKALEIVEAHWLFDLPASKIEVIIHPQSTVHSFVEFTNNSILAQLGPPDMKTPIQYALTYPRCAPSCSDSLDWSKLSRLDFEAPDHGRFRSLKLAYDVIEAGGTAGAVFNAANEAAVAAFLERRIRFGRIVELVAEALSAIAPRPVESLETVLAADKEARAFVEKQLLKN